MKVIAAISCVVALCLSLGLQAGAADLVGQWTFDGNGGTSSYGNKAPGISWSSLNLVGSGATITPDGKLVLPRYEDGAWKQSSATTMLRTDLGPGGYFKEMTQVAWIKWPGFDTSAVWSRITNMIKLSTDNYDLTDLTNTRAAQAIMMKATDDWNWGSHHVWEQGADPYYKALFIKNGGVDPPTDRYIKVAQVVLWKDNLGPGGTARYQQWTYWDIGAGMAVVGAVQVIYDYPPNYGIDAFGQYGTPSIGFPENGLRYDGFGFMDYSWSVPQSAGQIEFEEARIYSGMMTMAQIGALTPAPFVQDPAIPEPSALIALATGIFGLAGFASRRRK